ncbi:MAG: protein kinase [Candidatus Sulfotelmatobacter sp.]
MALTNGTRLGPYEIVAPLGAGGMGEVYRARDTRLDRIVALKILPPHFSDDATRRQRFEREAKVISSLNHPNICTLHDVGRQDGVDFIVMEYVEGESLGETRQLERGQIENYETVQWFRDGKSLLIAGNEAGKGTRFFLQEVAGGAPRPVTPEGTRDGLLSSDGKLVLARGPGMKYFVYPIADGEPRPVPGLTEADVLAQWSADGRSVLAYRRAEIPYHLERVDLATGNRKLFKELAPSDRTGLLSIRGVFVTDDLRSYAYTAYYQVSYLFISESSQ